ncbi:putative membrane protein [Helicobacter pylori Hp H-18]|nr:putative membrane protein [Helicobacter pylori Hp H-18]
MRLIERLKLTFFILYSLFFILYSFILYSFIPLVLFFLFLLFLTFLGWVDLGGFMVFVF